MQRRRSASVARACALALALFLIPSSASAFSFWGKPKDYAKTRYPVVLVPGVFGFKALFGAVEYFFGIEKSLKDSGSSVYVIELSAFNSSEERGEQLLKQLRTISAISGSPKLNIVAHSQGGLDSRYALAVRPDLFASLTTIGSPHQGSPVADFFLDHTTEGGVLRGVSTALVEGLGLMLNLLSGGLKPQDAMASVKTFSTGVVGPYNQRFAVGLPTSECGTGAREWNGVRLWSWSGSSPFTNPLDATDFAFGIAGLLIPGDSDGLVGRCSTHFGEVIRDDYTLNHADEVNQLLALANIFSTNPASVFRTHANRLKNEGL